MGKQTGFCHVYWVCWNICLRWSLCKARYAGLAAGRLAFLSLFLFILGSADLARADFESGLEAFEAGDYQKAFRVWLPLAKAGNMHAQHNLGVMYFEGLGVKRNLAEARLWYTLAAKQGYADAQFNLGVIYDLGQGVKPDYELAAKWYKMAAMQGHPQAQHNLAILFTLGQGPPRDLAQAYCWASLAAHTLDASQDQREASQAVVDKLEDYLDPDVIEKLRIKVGQWRRGEEIDCSAEAPAK